MKQMFVYSGVLLMLFGHSVFCDESDKDGGNGENGELVFVQIVRK